LLVEHVRDLDAEETLESREHPEHLDARVPVEAAVEGGMRLARPRPVVGALHHVVEDVRELATDVRERDVPVRGCELR
jgi:hypothetical protein